MDDFRKFKRKAGLLWVYGTCRVGAASDAFKPRLVYVLIIFVKKKNRISTQGRIDRDTGSALREVLTFLALTKHMV